MKNKYIALILLLIFVNYYFGNIEMISIEKKNSEPNFDTKDILNSIGNDTTAKIKIEELNIKNYDKKIIKLKSSNSQKNIDALNNKVIYSDTSDNPDKKIDIQPIASTFIEPIEKPVISGILYNQNISRYTAILIYKNTTYIVKESMKIDVFKIEKIEKDRVIVSVNNNKIILNKN